MSTLTIDIPPEQMFELEHLAETSGLSPEKIVLKSIEELLKQPEHDFHKAAMYVLNKNRALYERLA